MTRIYAGFNIADSMFDGNCTISRRVIGSEEFQSLMGSNVVPIFNHSHEATVRALKQRFNLILEIPQKPPRIILKKGDILLTVTLRGLPRHTVSYNYTDEEVSRATFIFAVYRIVTEG